ncbi:hypothetical protein NUSPORA_01356 [Nucleospora cyclopteri]
MTELLARIERLCQTKLNGKNQFKAVNVHSIYLVNYYTGILKLEPDDYTMAIKKSEYI